MAGDHYACARIADIIQRHGCNRIVETGTFLGATTRFLASFGLPVTTIEQNAEYHQEAARRLEDLPNVEAVHDDSAKRLPVIVPQMKGECVLFFLDAHWGAFWPLLSEIEAIAMGPASMTPVIVIHDFQIPDRPDLGYDSHNGRALCWVYVKRRIKRVYAVRGLGFRRSHNDEAAGLKRGIAYIEPER